MFAAALRPLLDVLRFALAAPAQPVGRTPLDLHKFDFGICPGCRGLRAVASPQCHGCGSAVPVAADA
jgi:hypothetical protein